MRARVAGPDQDEIKSALLGGKRDEVDLAVLAHRARVERADLIPVLIGGADETRRVVQYRLPDRRGAYAVVLQPSPVVPEVRADRADKQRPQTEHAEAVRDVGRDAAAPDGQVVHEERQRDLVQLVRDELLSELTRKRHQVVSRD